jgi:hypothetical protein
MPQAMVQAVVNSSQIASIDSFPIAQSFSAGRKQRMKEATRTMLVVGIFVSLVDAQWPSTLEASRATEGTT